MKQKISNNNTSPTIVHSKTDDAVSSADIKTSNSIELEKGQILCGDLDIRINSEGMWFYHGSPIGRKGLIKLFASVLNVDEEGKYWLITPAEKGEIIVEDVPFMAVEMTAQGTNEDIILTFRTNIDDEIVADRIHPIRVKTDPITEEPSPYIM